MRLSKRGIRILVVGAAGLVYGGKLLDDGINFARQVGADYMHSAPNKLQIDELADSAKRGVWELDPNAISSSVHRIISMEYSQSGLPSDSQRDFHYFSDKFTSQAGENGFPELRGPDVGEINARYILRQ